MAVRCRGNIPSFSLMLFCRSLISVSSFFSADAYGAAPYDLSTWISLSAALISKAQFLEARRRILVCQGSDLLLRLFVIGKGFLVLLPALAGCARHGCGRRWRWAADQ